MSIQGVKYKICILYLLIFSTPIFGRSIFLNGQDISSATSQELSSVNIRIDEKGNILITAPHYKVHKETHYRPLSSNRSTPKARLNSKQTPDQSQVPSNLIKSPTDSPSVQAEEERVSRELPTFLPKKREAPPSPQGNEVE